MMEFGGMSSPLPVLIPSHEEVWWVRFARVAQRDARSPDKAEVMGSTPIAGTSSF